MDQTQVMSSCRDTTDMCIHVPSLLRTNHAQAAVKTSRFAFGTSPHVSRPNLELEFDLSREYLQASASLFYQVMTTLFTAQFSPLTAQ